MLRRELCFQILVRTIERRPASSPFWIEHDTGKTSWRGKSIGNSEDISGAVLIYSQNTLASSYPVVFTHPPRVYFEDETEAFTAVHFLYLTMI